MRTKFATMSNMEQLKQKPQLSPFQVHEGTSLVLTHELKRYGSFALKYALWATQTATSQFLDAWEAELARPEQIERVEP